MASSGAASASDAPAAGESDAPGEASLLVSEFPPPPYYFRQAKNLTPPPIPHEALERGTAQAAAAAARARAESERLRLGDEAADKTDAILGGVSAVEDEQDGAVVAVFGEIVEDPFLVEPLDRCQDPAVVKDRVKELNQEILQGFVKLVQDLVNRPMDNKKTRDDLSHNIFLMLQECNKFREHQARELLIELMEKQLIKRRTLLEELQTSIQQADKLLDGSIVP